jgi:hypothetical protein
MSDKVTKSSKKIPVKKKGSVIPVQASSSGAGMEKAALPKKTPMKKVGAAKFEQAVSLGADKVKNTLPKIKSNEPPMQVTAISASMAVIPLSHYLSELKNKNSYEYALSKKHFFHERAKNPEYYDSDNEVWHSENLTESGERGDDLYIVGYQPDEWRMYGLLRGQVDNPRYYATDAILAQYTVASESLGFFGVLPKKLSMVNINNPLALKMLEETKGMPDMETFLTKTDNGKLAMRLASAIGKKVVKMNVSDSDITHVEFIME